jgi:hypothetical protein
MVIIAITIIAIAVPMALMMPMIAPVSTGN